MSSLRLLITSARPSLRSSTLRSGIHITSRQLYYSFSSSTNVLSSTSEQNATRGSDTASSVPSHARSTARRELFTASQQPSLGDFMKIEEEEGHHQHHHHHGAGGEKKVCTKGCANCKNLEKDRVEKKAAATA